MPSRYGTAIRIGERTAPVSSAPMSSTQARWRSWLAPAVAAVLLCAALGVLHGQLQEILHHVY